MQRLFFLLGSVIDAPQSVQAAGVTDKGQALRNDLD